MFEWIVLIIMLLAVPAAIIWQVGYKGFLPDRRCIGVIIKIDPREEKLVNDSGRHRKIRYVMRNYLIIEYRIDGMKYTAESIIPDHTGTMKTGDAVEIVAGRNKNFCYVKNCGGI